MSDDIVLSPVKQPDGSTLYSLCRGVPVKQKTLEGLGDSTYDALIDNCLFALSFFLRKPTSLALAMPVASRMIEQAPRRRRRRRAREVNS